MSKRVSKSIINTSNIKKKTKNKQSIDSDDESPPDALQELNKVNIRQLMANNGPIVKCVLLKCDGTMEEVEVDMTPRVKATQKLIGGEITFLGQWEDLEVVLLISQNQATDDSKLNKHKLQPPFHSATVYGDILLTRSDENGEPADFSLDEYLEFTRQEISEWEPPEDDYETKNNDDNDEDEFEDVDDDEEGDENEEYDEEENEAALLKIQTKLIEAFTAQNQRPPTDEELQSLLDSLLGGMDDEEDEDFDDDNCDDGVSERK